ncbi:MAG: hypothetical protein FWD17_12170, partial [Polyangiaceae bacterium]|nr:hypothetical protein [Polyangiaceae bacterium]
IALVADRIENWLFWEAWGKAPELHGLDQTQLGGTHWAEQGYSLHVLAVLPTAPRRRLLPTAALLLSPKLRAQLAPRIRAQQLARIEPGKRSTMS